MKISEETFLSELLNEIPEFKDSCREDNDHEIGIHLVFGDLKRMAQEALLKNDIQLLERIQSIIVRCHEESSDEANNAVFVTFFETMNEETLNYFQENLPEEFAQEIKEFLDVFDKATASVAEARKKESL